MKKICIIGSLLIASPNLFAESQTSQKSPNQPSLNNKTITIKQTSTGVRWMLQPRIRFDQLELQGQSRKIVVKIYVDTSGLITTATIEKSSGLAGLDQKIVQAVKKAKFRPYKENGVAYPFVATQPFELAFTQNTVTESKPEPEFCTLDFNSKNWRAQYLNKETKFEYQTQPQSLTIKNALMGNSEKTIDFSFELSRKNVLSNIALLRSSGVAEIDNKVLSSLANAQIKAPRKFWQIGNLKFQDQIVFWKSYCR